ncbi:MAG: cytochrome c [Leptothrix sp. (in: b-proteobacteria)]
MSLPCATPRQPRSGMLAALPLAALALLGSPAAQAMDAQTLRTRALAATCAHCHGTDGQAVQGEALVRLADLPEDYILTQLTAFRTGQRPATIMHQISRGYSQEQLETLARYFGSRNKK